MANQYNIYWMCILCKELCFCSEAGGNLSKGSVLDGLMLPAISHQDIVYFTTGMIGKKRDVPYSHETHNLVCWLQNAVSHKD